MVAYYWASWNQQTAADFFTLMTLIKGNAGNVEVVCVNLDQDIANARAFLDKTPGPEIQVRSSAGRARRPTGRAIRDQRVAEHFPDRQARQSRQPHGVGERPRR